LAISVENLPGDVYDTVGRIEVILNGMYSSEKSGWIAEP